MQPRNVELTKIGNKERLRHLVERAQNIFKVCVRNYENDVIKFAEDIDRAVANPMNVSGWDRPWQSLEITKLKDAAKKCQESRNVAEEAKELTLKIADKLTYISEQVYLLSEVIDKCEELAAEFVGFEDSLKIALSKLDAKSKLSAKEKELREDLYEQLSSIADGSNVLKSLRPGANQYREGLADSVESVTNLFFDEELPERKFELQQEIDSFVGLIDDLHTKVVRSFSSQNQILSELSGFIDEMEFNCKELIFVVEGMLNSSKEQRDYIKQLIESVK